MQRIRGALIGEDERDSEPGFIPRMFDPCTLHTFTFSPTNIPEQSSQLEASETLISQLTSGCNSMLSRARNNQKQNLNNLVKESEWEEETQEL